MLKPVTMSVSLALALGVGGLAFAGGHGGAWPAPQSIASEQCVTPTEQCAPSPQCEAPCAPKKSCFEGLGHKMNGLKCGIGDLCGGIGHGFGDLCKSLKPKPKCYTYTWVLKKKRVWGHHGGGETDCNDCGESYVTASEQGYASPQSYGSPQAEYAAPAYGTGQAYAAPTVYGAGQAYGVPASGQMTAPAAAPAMPAAPEGDMAPPAPEVPGPSAARTNSLLFLAPAGN